MMSKVALIVGAAASAIFIAAVVSIIVARVRWRRLRQRLNSAVIQRRQRLLAPQRIETLPEPVQRYLHRAVGNMQPCEWIEIREEGEFRSFAYPKWGKLRARALYTGTVPGMMWHAWVWYSPLRWYTIELLYAAGIGRGTLKLWNALVLFDPDGPEANEALLVRVLMETVWFPMSLVPGGLLRWEPLDRADAARAILTDHGITIRADFYFTPDGDVERIVTLDKYRDADTGYERDQCTMYCRNWQTVGGVRIPMEVRLEWNLDSGNFEYMRRRILDIRYLR